MSPISLETCRAVLFPQGKSLFWRLFALALLLPGSPAFARETAPAVPVAEDRCADTQRIRLNGAGLIPPAKQRKIVAPFEGQCLKLPQVNNLLKAVSRFYQKRGYVASRVYLPKQEFAGGELELLVVEGPLERLSSDESGPVARDLTKHIWQARKADAARKAGGQMPAATRPPFLQAT